MSGKQCLNAVLCGFDKIREACAKYDAPPEYNVSTSGIMVFCKACDDKYLELLNDNDLHLNQIDQVVMRRIWKNCNLLYAV